jgi:hypothetical protein
MTFRYSSGKTLEGLVLSQHGSSIHAAVQGCDDVLIFTAVNGMWVSEDGESVELVPAWAGQPDKEVVSESDCICPKELAAILIQSLRGADETQDDEDATNPGLSMGASSC